MSASAEPIPITNDARATTSAKAEQSVEQYYYWRSIGGQTKSFLTVAVSFQTSEDNSDIITPRARRQKVLDLLDEPPAAR
jgi:hypothetical protein